MHLRNGKVIGHQIQDDQCAVCMDIKFRPVRLSPCGHEFCDPCVRSLVNSRCPTCREEIQDCFHDHDLAAKMKEGYPNEYEERRLAEQLSPVALPLPGRQIWFKILSVMVDVIITLPILVVFCFPAIGILNILRAILVTLLVGYVLLLDLLHFIHPNARIDYYRAWKDTILIGGHASLELCYWVINATTRTYDEARVSKVIIIINAPYIMEI